MLPLLATIFNHNFPFANRFPANGNRPRILLSQLMTHSTHGSAPPTPPDMRVRIRRFGELSHERTVNRGIPSESK